MGTPPTNDRRKPPCLSLSPYRGNGQRPRIHHQPSPLRSSLPLARPHPPVHRMEAQSTITFFHIPPCHMRGESESLDGHAQGDTPQGGRKEGEEVLRSRQESYQLYRCECECGYGVSYAYRRGGCSSIAEAGVGVAGLVGQSAAGCCLVFSRYAIISNAFNTCIDL